MHLRAICLRAISYRVSGGQRTVRAGFPSVTDGEEATAELWFFSRDPKALIRATENYIDSMPSETRMYLAETRRFYGVAQAEICGNCQRIRKLRSLAPEEFLAAARRRGG